MNLDSRNARLVLAASLGLGVLADLLLRETPWGLNATLWTLALVAAAIVARARLSGGRALAWPLVVAAIFALGFAWRASPTLLSLFGASMLTAWATALIDRPARAGVLVHALAPFATQLSAALAPALVLPAARGGTRVGTGLRPVATTALGALLAAPLLLVFGALFASADPLFERYVVDLVHAIDDALEHLGTILFAAWMACGLLVGLGWIRCPTTLIPARRGTKSGEILVALALVAALFLAFLAVQLRALFGGHEYVAATVGLSYAEYARQGFFQLVACAAIALPLLLAADWAVPHAAPHRRRFVGLAVALAIMIVAVLASAARRMGLYVDAYGLTELRLYSSAFMVWLVLVGLVFGITALTRARERFAIGALAAGWAVVAGLAVLDPDAAIVRVNAARAPGSPVRFDARYATSLSADSVPELIEALPALDPASRCTVAQRLLMRWGAPAEPDWRTWSLSRWRARAAVEEAREDLRSAVRTCPRAVESRSTSA